MEEKANSPFMVSFVLNSRSKQRLHNNQGQTYLRVLEVSLAKKSAVISLCGDRISGAEVPGNNLQCELPYRLPCWKNLVPPIRSEKLQAKK